MFLIGTILILLVVLLGLFAFSISVIPLFGPPFVPTPRKIILELLELAEINKDDTIIDLGSGDGAILIEAAKQGATANGFEINPFLALLTRIKARFKGVHNKVSVHILPYQQANLQNATIVFCYCLPKYIPAIEKKLKAELKLNTKIITYKFKMPSLKIIKQTKTGLSLYSLT